MPSIMMDAFLGGAGIAIDEGIAKDIYASIQIYSEYLLKKLPYPLSF